MIEHLASVPPAGRGAKPLAPIRVVLADDHAMLRNGLRLLLDAQAGLRVVGEAGDGAEAVALALTFRPQVVVIDVMMPIKDGADATREIKAARPEIAVLAITGYDAPEHVVRMLDAGATGFLVKGASGAVLINAIHAVARGEMVLPPEIAARALLQRGSQNARMLHASPPLSDREMDVLREATNGLPNKEIARRLSLSVRTVHTHLGNIFAKLGVNSRTEAVLLALRRNWVSLDDQESHADSGEA